MLTDEEIKQEAERYSQGKSIPSFWQTAFIDGYKRAHEDQKEMIEALKATNEYFVKLQNKCTLTANDERAWKYVSKILNYITS